MIFLWDNKIYLYEAIILISLWPIYIVINICFFGGNNEEVQEGNNEKTKLLAEEKTQENMLDQDIK